MSIPTARPESATAATSARAAEPASARRAAVPADEPSHRWAAEGPRTVSVLGATGSIGQSTLDLIGRSPERFEVLALTANRNVERLAAQAKAVGARRAVVADASLYHDLRAALGASGIEAAAGPEAVVEAADMPSDLVVAGIVGAVGLPSTLTAIRRGAVVALANKETLVCAGQLMTAEVERCGAVLLPVDSEHNAIFQVFEQRDREAIEKIILTASGGPFRECAFEVMARATPAQAIKHPNWSMGAKISVDSATMMNKGLELIEAVHLFGMAHERVEILVHPQSIVHSMVAYADGSVLAQLGTPDMRTPIAYTLAWPSRMAAPVERLDLAAIGQLTFEAPDVQRFPALTLAREALAEGPAGPIILNAANEVAVEAFLAGRIGFLQIAEVIERGLESMDCRNGPGALEEVFALDVRARDLAGSLVDGLNAS